MVSPNAIKLSVYLISSYFGDLNAKVCECLLQRGTLTLAQILRYTELSKENVRNCLLVLIHQNCVQAFAVQTEGGFGEAPRINTQYMAMFDNIIHHMRFPKFLEIVSNELGKECEDMFEGLLQHGRLSVKQIIDRVKQMANQGNLSEESLLENFHKLVDARYVERCPAPEPFLKPPVEEEGPAKKKGPKTGKKAQEIQTIEQRAISLAAPMESLRFLVDTSDEEITPTVTPGQKRKKDQLDSDSGINVKKEVLWRVNFEEFVRILRHKACVANVRERINDEAGIVLEAILELSKRSETKVKTEYSAPLSVKAIYNELIKKEGGLGLNFDLIRSSIVQMGCQEAMICLDEDYSIDLKNIIELCQNEEVESIVLKRYGREAYRMFRLMSKTGTLLETEKISDTTFVEKKDALKLLYKMWDDGYVQMQKVTAGGAKSFEYMLWKVKKEVLWEHILDETYHAALNLRLRLANELEKEKEILKIPRDKLVGELASKYRRLLKVRIILESSVMNLDDSLLLFNDF